MTGESGIGRLLQVMARLRDPQGGCPWDLEQDFSSIAPYTIEEAYEVADAIERNDLNDLEGELGDLLLQVVYHARMAEEAGRFDFEAVASRIAEKMIRRHPHVFGDAEVDGAAAQSVAWEDAKAAERQQTRSDASVLADLPLNLPALTRSAKLQRRAARVGFDWPDVGPVWISWRRSWPRCAPSLPPAHRTSVWSTRSATSCSRPRTSPAIWASTARPRCARRTSKFERRFRAIERSLAAAGRRAEDASLDEMEELWPLAGCEGRRLDCRPLAAAGPTLARYR